MLYEVITEVVAGVTLLGAASWSGWVFLALAPLALLRAERRELV